MKKFKKGVILVGILSLLAGLFGCRQHGEIGKNGVGNKGTVNTSGISSFYYSYNGSIGGDSFSYKLTSNDGELVFTFESMEYDFPDGGMSIKVPFELLNEIEEAYINNEVYKWDGFSKTNVDILDGNGFGLSISFNDGKYLSASGSNAYPKNYKSFKNKISELLKPYASIVIEQRKNDIISQGFSGNLNLFMINFISQGKSGKDSYKFLVCRNDIRESNFVVTIESYSGEYFEIGNLKIYDTIDENKIYFDEVKALIEKYNVMSWYGFNKSAEDYNNCEWFQIDFIFDEGNIQAHGTLHPDNYDEFRDEFLKLMAKNISSLKEGE